MNHVRLQMLFREYIKNFAFINNKEHDETDKWAIVQSVQDCFDLECDNFAAMLKEVCKLSENMISSGMMQGFTAMVYYAQKEPETVRRMFAELFQKDRGDLHLQQERIDAFRLRAEELRKAYFSEGAWNYINDQRTVMAYLFLHDPDHHYLYRAGAAHSLAVFTEYEGDWGSGADFRLDGYYRMCDQLISDLNKTPELLKLHQSRFRKDSRSLFPDLSRHLLAYDLLSAAYDYDFYADMEPELPDIKQSGWNAERRAAAEKLKSAYDALQADADALQRIRSHLCILFLPGTRVIHKTYGTGMVEWAGEGTVTVRFPSREELVTFRLLPSLANGLLSAKLRGVEELVQQNRTLMQKELEIPRQLEAAGRQLIPYLEDLED